MLRCVVMSRAVLCLAGLCSAVLSDAVLGSAVLYNLESCCSMLRYVALCCSV